MNELKKRVVCLAAAMCSAGVVLGADESVAAVGAGTAAGAAIVEVDLSTMVRDSLCGQVLVTCLVHGQPMRMMLDTGATHTVLHDESAARLVGARWPDTSRMKFSGNSAQTPRIVVGSLQVGAVSAPEHPFLVVSLAAVRSMMAEPVDGILGMDVLGAMAFTFDLKQEKYYWGVPEGLVLQPLYGTRDENGRMMVRVHCEGRPLELLLDTGSSITRVYADEWKPGAGGEAIGHMGNVDKATRLKVVRGKAADVELVPGVVSRKLSPVFCSRDDRSMLGMDALTGHVLIHLPGRGTPYGSFFLAR